MKAGKGGEGAGLVYSTEYGRMCPGCGRPAAGCACRKGEPASAAGGPVRVGRETKGRKGRSVTVITGLPLDRPSLAKLGRELRKRCGSGGTVKDGVIEIQGDHRDVVVEELGARGWKVKRSGG